MNGACLPDRQASQAKLHQGDEAGKQIIYYHPKTYANTKGATIVASLSIIYFGVLMSSFPHVIFYEGKDDREHRYKNMPFSNIFSKSPLLKMY
jgi:hypothetical protein